MLSDRQPEQDTSHIVYATAETLPFLQRVSILLYTERCTS